jgi:hypothetical protein
MPYKFLRDPLFIFCIGLYFVNRWCLKPLFSAEFFHSYLNDLICIPFWVPIMLWAMHKVGVRPEDDPPRWYEIVIPLIVSSVVFEMLVPHMERYRRLSHADPLDVLCYACGALFASWFWRIWYSEVRLQRTNGSIEAPTVTSVASQERTQERIGVR